MNKLKKKTKENNFCAITEKLTLHEKAAVSELYKKKYRNPKRFLKKPVVFKFVLLFILL